MSNLQNRIDVTDEIRACEHIWSFDDAQVDSELRHAGIDPDGLLQRLEAGFGAKGQANPAAPESGHGSTTGVATPGFSAVTALGAAPQSAPPSLSRSALMSRGPAAATMEISGRMKFFDAAKGYGFFVIDDLTDKQNADVLVHVSHLNAAGYRTIYEGARIYALAQRTAKGLQVVQILSIDDTSAIHPSQIPQRTREKVQAESTWVHATVKWYNTAQGFGFVCERAGSPDCFVHADVLRRWGMPPLRAGQVVEIRWGTGTKGRMVAEIRHPGAGSGLPPVH